jgi:hypothetical protein
MSFSADKVNVLKGAFSQRRFSSSKDPSESGEYCQLLYFFMQSVRYVMLWELRLRISGTRDREHQIAGDTDNAIFYTAERAPEALDLEISDSKVLSARPQYFPSAHVYPSIPAVSLSSNPSASMCHTHSSDMHWCLA